MFADFQRITHELKTRPWALPPNHLRALASLVSASGPCINDSLISALAERGARKPESRTAGGALVAVLPVHGLLVDRRNMLCDWGLATSYESIRRDLRAAQSDPTCRAVVLDVDSAGGVVTGVDELAEAIYDSSKPVVAAVNSMACSAAYWLGAAAHHVVSLPSGYVGSVGVYCLHVDYSGANRKAGVNPTYVYAGKYKTEGNPDEPLSDEGRAWLQRECDAFHGRFVRRVAQSRGVGLGRVIEGFGQGRALTGRDGLAVGMVDGLGTLEDAVKQAGDMSKWFKAAGGNSNARHASARRRASLQALVSAANETEVQR